MKITFLGTRGYIDAQTARHRRHTTTLITYKKTRILIDWGADWLEHPYPKNLAAIFVTHAHPDHAWGLLNGAPCPVYATHDAWKIMHSYAITQQKKLTYKKRVPIGDMFIIPFPVIHSLRAPAVGYRITAGRATIFYVPDLIAIEDRKKALTNVKLYIGDGATIDRPLVRRSPEGKLFGHTTIKAQLGWCAREHVPRAIFTHCGTQIVAGKTAAIRKKIARYAHERGIDTRIAYDGMEVVIR